LGKATLHPNLGTGQLNHNVPKQPRLVGRDGGDPISRNETG
jgi:hypothetical protein